MCQEPAPGPHLRTGRRRLEVQGREVQDGPASKGSTLVPALPLGFSCLVVGTAYLHHPFQAWGLGSLGGFDAGYRARAHEHRRWYLGWEGIRMG